MSKYIELPCCSCGGEEWIKNKYNLLEVCKKCGLVRAKKIPTAEELTRYYQQDYYFGQEYSDYIKDRPALEVNFKKRIDLLNKLSKDSIKLKVLEIGSAYGFFLNLMKQHSSEMIGFEVSSDGAAYSREQFDLNVTNEEFLDFKIKKNYYDVVAMWDVVEHINNPAAYIKKASASLKVGGLLALTTGDIGAALPKARGDKWRMIHPPTHLYYFNKQSMHKLLESNGLSIVHFSHPAHWRNLGSVLEQLRLNNVKSKNKSSIINLFIKLAKKSKMYKLNFGLNTGDIMLVVAEKK